MSTDAPNDLLSSFAEEVRRNIRLDMDGARAVEASCWFSALRAASRELGALTIEDPAGYQAGAPDVVGALRIADEAWPLPTLLGRTVLNLDGLVSLAAAEIKAEGGVGVSEFEKVFREQRERALHDVLVEATVDLTRLVRALQAWDGALTIATRAPELSGETFSEELRLEHVGLVDLFVELEHASAVEEMRSRLLSAVDAAESQARDAMEEAGQDGLGRRLRRGWSASLAGAQAQLHRRKDQALYRLSAAWSAHHDALWARVELLEGLLRFRLTVRDELKDALDTLYEEAVTPVRAPLQAATDTLRSVREQSLGAEQELGQDWTKAATAVSGYRVTTAAAVGRALEALAAVPIDDTSVHVSDRCVGACQGALGRLPEHVQTVELEKTEPSEWPLKPVADLTPREWAGRAVDLERLSSARASLLSVVDAVRTGIEQAAKAPEVLAYNMEAALDEMRTAAETGSAREAPWVLVRTGLDRSADYLDRIGEAVELAHLGASHTITDDFNSAEIELLARLTQEDAWGAELSDGWSDALDRARNVGRSVRGGGRQAAALTGRVAAGAFSRARTAMERARRLIGGGSTSSASDETLRELSAVDAQASALPFVYRRLFSPRPVEDPTLFVGRDNDIEAVLSHWQDWLAGRTNTLVITGAFGGGMRSLMSVARMRSGDPDVWRRATLTSRVDSEEGLARVLAAAVLDEPSEPANLEELAVQLASLDGPRAVHVERMEHAFERTVEGFALIEAAFEFFSRTDSRVGWFVTMPYDAWRLLVTVSPTSAGLARQHTVGALDQDGLSLMLKARHHRSGLALEFDESSVPKAALRDRKEAGAVERAFFTRFWALTDGSAPLALLYWIRSATHEPESEHVTISWPEELDFAFLDALSWDQVFALQAFAEHGTLTVADHARVFSMASDRSYDLLESLGNLYLIEPAGAIRRVGEQLTFATVEAGTPYRIRPVLHSVVRRVLRARHLTGQRG